MTQMKQKQQQQPKFHIMMLPWFAVGHLTPFLQLSNKLAQKGYTITFLVPKKTQSQIQHLNLHPHLIKFHPLTIPHVDGLPLGAETASDVPFPSINLIATALDRSRDQIEAAIRSTKPHVIFNDLSHWLSEITRPLGIKIIHYSSVCAAAISIAVVPAREHKPLTEQELVLPPEGYPSKHIVLRSHEVRTLSFLGLPFGEGVSFFDRLLTTMKESDGLALRTCTEIEGALCDYIRCQYNKPVLLSGPVLSPGKTDRLDESLKSWLDGFETGSVVFCAFGSQCILEKDQFQELLLGFEMTGLPFLVALKPPIGASTVEEVFPVGFEERVKGRGVVCGGWVQQVLILDHPSIGCFVNHCGFGSMWESLMSDCQIVLVPHLADQILNTRLMADELKVAVEVKREENGWFSKESLCDAVRAVMDKESEVGDLIRKNHGKAKETLVSPGFMSGYFDHFVDDMLKLCPTRTTSID